MAGRNPREKWNLKLDFVQRLISLGCVLPDNSVSYSEAKNWFIPSERQLAEKIIEELLSNPDAPIVYVNEEETEFGITDIDEARDFMEDLYDDPPWFRS